VRGHARQRRELGVSLFPHGVFLVTQPPAACRERRELLALLGRWRSLAALAGAVLLGAELFELGPQRAIDGARQVGAATSERRADGVRIATDQLDVENGPLLAPLAG
jgi:hypothetical protein